MKLSLTEKPELIWGMPRMTPALLEFWRPREAQCIRAKCTAGGRVVLRTDSRFVRLGYRIGVVARPFYDLGLVADGGAAQVWPADGFRQDERRPHTLDIWLTHAVETQLDWLEIEDGATLEPVRPPTKTWLAIGDSITQGMLSANPARTYVAVAARAAGVSVRNVGVGGEIMQGKLGALCREIPADFATVALGVNDYNQKVPLDVFAARTYELLTDLPHPVSLITPTPWVGKQAHELEAYRQVLRDVAATFPAVRVIEGPTLLSGTPELYADGLHPNDAGMTIYGNNLARLLG